MKKGIGNRNTFANRLGEAQALISKTKQTKKSILNQ